MVNLTGVSRTSIFNYVKDRGIEYKRGRNKNVKKDDIKTDVISRFKNNESPNSIAKYYNCSWTVIDTILKDAGLK